MANGAPRKGGNRRDAASRRGRASTPPGQSSRSAKGSPKTAGKASGRPAAPSSAKNSARHPGPSPAPRGETAGTGIAPGTFRLGAIPGATPGTWIDTWRTRVPQLALELVPLTVAGQRDALLDGGVDAALVRLPIDKAGLHVIPLYDEVPVVVVARDSHLLAADELEPADLDGEVVIVPGDDVLGIRLPGAVAPRFAPPAGTADAIATAAAGVGAVIVPMSLARLHRRKDADFRILRTDAVSTVALAWLAERTTPAVEAFVGIVRGRTANSSRG